MQVIFGWFWIIFTTTTYSSVSGFDFSVLTTGTYPRNNIDDIVAIQWAIDTAIKNGSNNTIVLSVDTYDIKSPLDPDNTVNLTTMCEEMWETLLLGHSQRSVFTADVAFGLILTSLSIDFDPLSFTVGYVINVDSQVEVNLRYDPTAMRIAFGSRTYEIYQTPASDRNTSIVAGNVIRILFASPSKFIVWDPVVVPYASQYHAIAIINVTDLSVWSVTPRLGQWMSTNVDYMHFIDNRESIHLSDSRCEAQGDDGLNSYCELEKQHAWNLASIKSSTLSIQQRWFFRRPSTVLILECSHILLPSLSVWVIGFA